MRQLGKGMEVLEITRIFEKKPDHLQIIILIYKIVILIFGPTQKSPLMLYIRHMQYFS